MEIPFLADLRSFTFDFSRTRERFGGECSRDLEEVPEDEEPVSDSESDADESEETVYKVKKKLEKL